MQDSITVYDGPGRARKQCPNGHFVHAKRSTCVCGHVFKARIEPIQQVEKVYDGPGKGRKHCPGCNTYVGVRTNLCKCGFSFDGHKTVAIEAPPSDVVTYTEGGKGRKKCPECTQFVGCRVKECSCGYDFDAQFDDVEHEINLSVELEDEVEVGVEPTLRSKLGYPNHRTTYIPAGSCPHKLDGIDEETVVDWINKVQQHFIARGEVLAPSGFSYYARHYYDVFGSEYNAIKQVIRKHFAPITG
jgi:hypothetical protein